MPTERPLVDASQDILVQYRFIVHKPSRDPVANNNCGSSGIRDGFSEVLDELGFDTWSVIEVVRVVDLKKRLSISEGRITCESSHDVPLSVEYQVWQE